MKKILFASLLLFSCFTLFAENEAAADSILFDTGRYGNRRPRVGLVLSGGGAKGMAHIGAIKMIEDLGIPVDFVVGTSIGSIMGGLYSLGYTAEQLDSLSRAQDWNRIMNDEVERRRLSFETKKNDEQFVVNIPFGNAKSFTESINGDGGKRGNFLQNIPSALVSGQNLNKLFTKLSVGYQGDVDFNEFPIPFACVAVDLNSNEEVVFHSGNVVDAMRASMSIPGFFAPVERNGMCLIDGGILNNFPVDVAREMGADIVIGVDLHHFRRSKPVQVKSIGEMIGRMLDSTNGEKYAKGREDADIIIDPNTNEYGVLAFDKESINALIDSGYVAARRQYAALEALALMEKRMAEVERGCYMVPSRADSRPKPAVNLDRDSVMISQIVVHGADSDDLNWLMSKTGLKPGEILSGEEIDHAMDIFYDTKTFEKIEFSVLGNEKESYCLDIRFVPRKRHMMSLGFRYDTEDAAAILLGLGLNRNKLFGFKFNMDFKLASRLKLQVNAGYTFLNMTQLNISGKLWRSEFHSVDTKGWTVLNDPFMMVRGQVDYQVKSPKNADFRFGAAYTNHFLSEVLIDWDNESEDGSGIVRKINPYPLWSGFISYEFDNYDDSYFPTKGLQFETYAGYNTSRLTAGDGRYSFADANVNFKVVIPVGRRFALIPQAYNRFVFQTKGVSPDIFKSNWAGGNMPGRYLESQLPLIGVNNLHDFQQKVAIQRLDVRCNVFGKQYVVLKSNYILDWDKFSNFEETWDGAWGASVGYWLNTVIGPVGADIQWSSLTNAVSFYLGIGYNF